ncbi:MAG: type II secretion system inner membrane protein GspF [Pseudomonadota bacterium]|nr:type II secretion system inner membrane protein GspF [Pseudomonadota bacterium]
MPAYQYEALDAQGKKKKGMIAADSLRDARKRLQSKTLFPVSLTEGGRAEASDRLASTSLTSRLSSLLSSLSSSSTRSAKISSRDLAMVTRQMATMVGAGLPLDETLQAIAAQSEKPLIRDVLTNIRSRVVEGEKLSEAMKVEAKSFDDLYRAMIAAGEASGDLGGILARISEYCDKSEDVRTKVQAAMVYPVVLSVIATGVLVLLMTFVVPKIAVQFVSFNAELPALTRFVIGLSDILTHLGPAFLLIIIAAGIGYTAAMRRKPLRLKVHGFWLQLPLVGRLLRVVASARFARTLGTLVEGGSPVPEAILAARETQTNQVVRDAVDGIYKDDREGSAHANAFRKSGIFAPLLVYMVAMGEKSGSLSHMLTKTADYLEGEFDGVTRTLMNLLEPAIVVIMGLMVGVIVMSIMLPIMRLNSLVLS